MFKWYGLENKSLIFKIIFNYIYIYIYIYYLLYSVPFLIIIHFELGISLSYPPNSA
ncbi:MAG: hypothetical protein N7Q72_05910 [Spiroplasma sp. Tabriz.8]|nr:hypothetical protein [Spiroplasma sp. Tabriz.8]